MIRGLTSDVRMTAGQSLSRSGLGVAVGSPGAGVQQVGRCRPVPSAGGILNCECWPMEKRFTPWSRRAPSCYLFFILLIIVQVST